MVKRVEHEWLPDVGEAVSVDWGLKSVKGRVVEAYSSGSRPRAVVEIEPGEVADEAVTVTVPLDAIEPLSSMSKWSQGVQFERSVAAAVTRVLGDIAARMEQHPSSSPNADLILTLPDGRVLVVEAKASSGNTSSREIDRGIQQLRTYVDPSPHAIGLLVVDHDPPSSWRSSGTSNVSVVRWRDEHDDQELRESLSRLLDA